MVFTYVWVRQVLLPVCASCGVALKCGAVGWIEWHAPDSPWFMECSRCGKTQPCKRGTKTSPDELDRILAACHVLCVKFKSRSLCGFLLWVSFWLHKFSFVKMHMTADHVEERHVLYNCCIALKLFVTQSELELRECITEQVQYFDQFHQVTIQFLLKTLCTDADNF